MCTSCHKLQLIIAFSYDVDIFFLAKNRLLLMTMTRIAGANSCFLRATWGRLMFHTLCADPGLGVMFLHGENDGIVKDGLYFLSFLENIMARQLICGSQVFQQVHRRSNVADIVCFYGFGLLGAHHIFINLYLLMLILKACVGLIVNGLPWFCYLSVYINSFCIVTFCKKTICNIVRT